MPELFDAVTIGALALRNRIVMAPMTSCRAPGAVPNEMMIAYEWVT
jgi:N-ethylmaleimide reductase